MSISKQPSPYTAYLLRCWLEGSTWRYSLEEVGTGKRHGFATLDELVSFLLAQSMQPGASQKHVHDADLLVTCASEIDLAPFSQEAKGRKAGNKVRE